MSNWKYKIQIKSNDHIIAQIEEFTLHPSKITLLFGESGIGKSILSKAIYGLLDSDELQVTVNDKPYKEYLRQDFIRQAMANGFFVFQEPSSHLNPVIKLQDQLSEGSLSQSALEEIDTKLLWNSPADDTYTDLQEIYPQPFRPSGGEKQRMLLTMAFRKINLFLKADVNHESALFVFDEPSGSLDDALRNRFLNLLLRKFQQKPFTTLLITHDYSIIGEIFHRYPKLTGQFDFKELYRENDHVAIRSFDPQSYLSWIQNVTATSAKFETGKEFILQVHNKFKTFGRSLQIFQDKEYRQPADLVIRPGEMVYLKAASGVGKTTLAKLITGLYRADRFIMKLTDITVNQNSPAKIWAKNIWGKSAGMVFQHADEALDLQADVYHIFKGLPGKKLSREDVLRELQTLFENKVDPNFLKKKVLFLSGGQKQRLNLLRTFLLETDLIILDEPLNGLDFHSIRKALDIIEEQRQKGRAILIISHNEEIFDSLIDEKHIYYLGIRN